MEKFNNKDVQGNFDSWLTISGGISENPVDRERFFQFVVSYFNNKEQIDKDSFDKMCKKHTHTTRRIKRGICQKYYRQLEVLVEFLSWEAKQKYNK